MVVVLLFFIGCKHKEEVPSLVDNGFFESRPNIIDYTDILATDVEYQDTLNVVGTNFNEYHLSMYLPLKKEHVDAKSSIHDIKINGFDDYRSYLKKLPLNDNTYIVEFRHPEDKTIIYSVMDIETKQSLLMIVLKKSTIDVQLEV